MVMVPKVEMDGAVKKILVLAPHTDDGELGCGGTMARLHDEGAHVTYVAFSACEESMPPGFPPDTLRKEVVLATTELGVARENLIVKDYKVRKLSSRRQDILEELVLLRNSLKPDMIFMPCQSALHQDHAAIYNEGIRAFKHYTCFGYDLPWDSIQFSSTAFFKLNESQVERKCKALEHYKSQKFRTYVDNEFIRGLARVRGAQIGVQYAEAFELIRTIF